MREYFRYTPVSQRMAGLQFFDPTTGKDVQTHAEERQGRIRAELEIARLRAMLEQQPAAGARDAPSDGT